MATMAIPHYQPRRVQKCLRSETTEYSIIIIQSVERNGQTTNRRQLLPHLTTAGN